MREFAECKAEILRRSKKRIQARRRACTHVLGTTLAAVILIAILIPKPEENTQNGSVQEDGSGSYICSYTEVRVQNAGSTQAGIIRFTDKVKVTRIFEMIHELENSVGGEVSQTPESGKDFVSGIAGYVITFLTEDGSQRVYMLNENSLCNTEKTIRITLTDDQMTGLKTVLGIPD